MVTNDLANIEGNNVIPVSLFEAVSKVDQGPIYLKDTIVLDGSELVDEWRYLQAEISFKLCLSWLDNYLVAKTLMLKRILLQVIILGDTLRIPRLTLLYP